MTGINIHQLFSNRRNLLNYREGFFHPHEELKIETGLNRPVLFIANQDAIVDSSIFHVYEINDVDFDIYVVSGNSIVLFYLIDLKAPMHKVVPNGIILRRRAPSEDDKKDVRVKYALEHFHVISNGLATATIFSKDITSDPST